MTSERLFYTGTVKGSVYQKNSLFASLGCFYLLITVNFVNILYSKNPSKLNLKGIFDKK